MNIQSINDDIEKLNKALRLIQRTENYLHFNKPKLMGAITEQIHILEDKREKQIKFINSLNKTNDKD